MTEIRAVVTQVGATHSALRWSESDKEQLVKVVADYLEAGVMSSVTFNAPAESARDYYIGQELLVSIEPRGPKEA